MPIIKDGNMAKQLWPAIELWYKATYDEEAAQLVKEIHEQAEKERRAKLTFWQRIKYSEPVWRIRVAWSIIRYGEESPELRSNDW